MEGRLLFNTKIDETVYDCLSQQIDVFDTILNNKMNISKIVNRGIERDCELNSQQAILVYNCMQYLRFSYLFMLEKNTRERNETYSSCCKKAIEQMEKFGVRIIKNHQILMKWNCTFCSDEVFPHPNNYIQHGYT